MTETAIPDPIVYFKELTFSGGVEVELSPSGVVVVVGPNNVGKSTALGEITSYVGSNQLAHNGRLNRIFASADFYLAPADDFADWLEQFADDLLPDPVNQPNTKRYRNWHAQLSSTREAAIGRFQGGQTRGELTAFLQSNGMQAMFEAQAPDVYGTASAIGSDNKQFEKLYYDPTAEARISKLSADVFGTPVSLSRFGRTSALHFGTLPEMDNPPSDEQRAALRAVPKLTEQGLGVTSLLNLAVTLELGEEPIVVLDEPEAHLHPPQAKYAGRFVAERGRRSQVFIATHSIEFLLGMLDKGVETTIIRLDRIGEVQSVAVLDKTELTKSWKDPAVRFSGALAGLMHKGVVLCEGDGDCRYFEVALDHLDGNPHDLRFVSGGGKAGIKKLREVLRTLAVPTVVITDFDLIREWAQLRDLYEATGGDAETIKPNWESVNQYLSSKVEKRPLSVVLGTFQAGVAELDQTQTYTPQMREKLRDTLKTQGGWVEGKEHGLSALNGAAFTAGEALLKQLRDRGIHVLPFGEVESFHPQAPTGLHGADWSTYVIDNELYKGLTGPLAQFVKDIPGVCFAVGPPQLGHE